MIGLEELGTTRQLKSAEAGSSVGVLCRRIDHQSIADAWEGEGENARIVGVTLTLGSKKRWWQF